MIYLYFNYMAISQTTVFETLSLPRSFPNFDSFTIRFHY